MGFTPIFWFRLAVVGGLLVIGINSLLARHAAHGGDPAKHEFLQSRTQLRSTGLASTGYVSFKSEKNGRFLWKGDDDQAVATADDLVEISRKSFSIIPHDATEGWVTLHYYDVAQSLCLSVGSPPAMQAFLSQCRTSDPAQVWRIQWTNSKASQGQAWRGTHTESMASSVHLLQANSSPKSRAHPSGSGATRLPSPLGRLTAWLMYQRMEMTCGP